jgi:hypothetical protein
MTVDRKEFPTTDQAERERAMSASRNEGALSTADIAAGRNQPARADAGNAAERTRAAEAAAPSSGPSAVANRPDNTPLFPSDAAGDFRSRWNEIQTGFVDDPRQAVEQADSLVAEVMKRLAETFAQERSRLEQQWDRGDQADTENLRMALQRYRSFFSRLLSM